MLERILSSFFFCLFRFCRGLVIFNTPFVFLTLTTDIWQFGFSVDAFMQQNYTVGFDGSIKA